MENPFQSQPLVAQKTVGERIYTARIQAKYSLDDLARATKVNAVYIEALEKGRYNDLPSPVYIRSYLKVVCELLGLSWENIEKQYKKEVASFRAAPVASHEEKKQVMSGKGEKRIKSTGQKISTPQSHEHKPAILVPQVLRYGIAALVVGVIVLYLTLQVVRIYNPPPLNITSPVADIQVSDHHLVVSGSTAPESVVEINGQRADVNASGVFSVDVYLQDGLNTLTISTKSQRSKPNVVVRHVLFEATATQKAEEKAVKKAAEEAAAALAANKNEAVNTNSAE